MSERSRRLGTHLLAALFYLLISAVVTYPLVLHLAGETLGPHYADRMQNMWNLWWTGTALLDRHTSPFHTDMLFYPQGADLYFHTLDLPLTLFAALPARIFGLVFGYNFSVLFALVLAGYAGWRLVLYLTGNQAAALIGGMVIAFNPLTQALVQGQINAVNLGPCVLCIEFYLRAWDTGTRRDAILAGLFFGLSVLTVGYYEEYLLLFFALHLAVGGRWSVAGGQPSRSIIQNSKLKTQNSKLKTTQHSALRTPHSFCLGRWGRRRSCCTCMPPMCW